MHTLRGRRVLLLTCLILVIFSLAIAFLCTPPASNTTPTSHNQTINAPYTVKAYHGYVAVFQGDMEMPSQVTGIRVSLLPLQDQLDLAEGIRLQSDTALAALLEDYGA